MFLGSFRLCNICLIIFILQIFLMYHFILNLFHKCERTNLIHVTIHGEETFIYCTVQYVENLSIKNRFSLKLESNIYIYIYWARCIDKGDL